MPPEFQMNDPRQVWQSQISGSFKLSAMELSRRAQQRQKKAQVEAIYSVLIGLILCAVFARALAKARDVMPRMGFGVLICWSLYFAYQTYRWILPGRLVADATLKATLNTTLEAYKAELEKRRDYARNIWRRAGLPFCFSGLAMVIGPGVVHAIERPPLLMNVLPVLILLALWIVIFVPMRRRNLTKLQQEIDELRLLGGEQ